MRLKVAMDVFVLGYPKGIDGGGEFPIWKRGSIATEPGVHRGGPPHILIDTATREGISGARAIAIADGDFDVEGTPPAYRLNRRRRFRHASLEGGQIAAGAAQGMSEMRNWLKSIGLGQYGDAFEVNEIDMDLLDQVDDQILKDIGVSPRLSLIHVGAPGFARIGQGASRQISMV
jgi:hypothetical protein